MAIAMSLVFMLDATESAIAAGGNSVCGTVAGERLPPSSLAGQLRMLRGGRPSRVELPKRKVYFLYYGASWCAPCRALGRMIRQRHQSGEARRLGYEVVFISRDRPGKDLEYVRDAAMPWPYLPAAATGAAVQVVAAGRHALPDMIAVDGEGRILCRAGKKSAAAVFLDVTASMK